MLLFLRSNGKEKSKSNKVPVPEIHSPAPACQLPRVYPSGKYLYPCECVHLRLGIYMTHQLWTHPMSLPLTSTTLNWGAGPGRTVFQMPSFPPCSVAQTLVKATISFCLGDSNSLLSCSPNSILVPTIVSSLHIGQSALLME